jgi:hypothetical protein
MIAKKKTVGLLAKLETSLTALIADMDAKNREVAYTLTDRMKVYDRVLKLEALKQGIGDSDEGEGFKDDD